MTQDRPDSSVPRTPERRATPRLTLVSPLVGQDDEGHDVTLVNVSDGGLLVYTPQSAEVGETRHFRFHVPGGSAAMTFAARVVHVLRISEGGAAAYAIGLEFVSALPAETRGALERIATAGSR
jgi:hypothetical protein